MTAYVWAISPYDLTCDIVLLRYDLILRNALNDRSDVALVAGRVTNS